MSRAPLAMMKADQPWARGNVVAYDTHLGWRFPNPRLEAMFPLEAMGETGENVAEQYGVSREEQDAFALASQQPLGGGATGRAASRTSSCAGGRGRRATSTRGRHDGREARRAEARRSATAARSRPGTPAALNDGAAALVIASEERARELGAEPLGAFVGSAAAGVDPRVMGIGPVPAVRKLLARAGSSRTSSTWSS